MPIGKLVKVPLRELWKHEERGFSAWLEANMDTLSEALELPLSVVQREKPVGSFQVDILAEDSNGGLVIIENQLEPTNHDHLGKLITYLTNLGAKTAVWITSDPRPEHSKAVEWLNEVAPADIRFYLVELAAYRIGNSDAAPLFKVVTPTGPETKSIGLAKGVLAERHRMRLDFWQQLLAKAKDKGVNIHAGRSPSKDNWMSAGAGRAGLSYNYVIRMEDNPNVELWINTGDKEKNKALFDGLVKTKETIEKNFGRPLIWERLDSGKGSQIKAVVEGGGLKEDASNWAITQEKMIRDMDRLSKAMTPHIFKLSV
jgi:uncharacterized protein DUF4268